MREFLDHRDRVPRTKRALCDRHVRRAARPRDARLRFLPREEALLDPFRLRASDPPDPGPDRVRVLDVDSLETLYTIDGYSFPHGLDIRFGLMAVTNYGWNTIDLRPAAALERKAANP